jgi:ABC-type transport system involved in cytochrome c biogenesis permease component
MAVVLLLIMLAPQLIQFAGLNWRRAPGTLPGRSALLRFTALNDLSPPGAALQAITGSGNARLFAVLLLLTFLIVSGLILRRQSRSVYLGELHSDEQRVRRDIRVSPGWKIPLLDDTVSTVFEKELRYLRQNTRLLLQIVYPMIIFAVFFSGRGPAQKLLASAHSSSAGLLGMMAGFLTLSIANLCYNNFGLDRDGFGRWMLAPVKMQKVLLAKNLAHASPFLLMYALISGLLLATLRVSLLQAATITVSFLTVILVQVGAGNLFSVYWPKNIDLTRMSSRTVSAAAGYAALLVIAPVGIVGGLIAMAAIYLSLPWLPLVAATVIFCVVIRLYFVALDRTALYIDHHLEEIEQALNK